MKNVEKIMICDDLVYVKKTGSGYKIVYPIKNEGGSINWKNFIAGGNWWNLAWVGLYVIIFIGAILEYTESLKYCSELVAEKIASENIISGLPNLLP